MRLNIAPGKYVVAVSGGVDSVVLLDLLDRQKGLELVVAHFDHGIRPDSTKDTVFVKQLAKDWEFVSESKKLGLKASEATARTARYLFLERTRQKTEAKAIITAHHQDDLIETAFINILRGTGWQGLSSIKNSEKLLRPLLDVSKKDILAYAKQYRLKWREDSTNQETDYLRNYLRLNILPTLESRQRQLLISKLDKVAENRRDIDNITATISHKVSSNNKIDRRQFAALPTEIATELAAFWLRRADHRDFDRNQVVKTVSALKTSKAGTTMPINGHLKLVFDSRYATFQKG